MVSLAKYLIADSVESYKEDPVDGQDVEALYDPVELQTRLAYRSGVAPDLRALLEEWSRGFVQLNVVENRLTELIEARDTGTVERVSTTLTRDEALELVEPGDVLVDCSGTRALMRDLLLPGADLDVPGRNTQLFHLEHSLVITFLYGQHYECNEYCKYYKNIESTGYKFIPAVHRTCYEDGTTHVTGIVSISKEEFESMPPRFDGDWLRECFPDIAASMDNFIVQVKRETNGEVIGDLEITRIPLDVYHAWNHTTRRWTSRASTTRWPGPPSSCWATRRSGRRTSSPSRSGSSARSSWPATWPTGALPMPVIFDRYETFMYQQWLRVYMRSQMIKHNKDLLQVVDDTEGLLAKLHIY